MTKSLFWNTIIYCFILGYTKILKKMLFTDSEMKWKVMGGSSGVEVR